MTTPPSVRSGIGDYTQHLLPHLCEHADVDAYVEAVGEGDVDPAAWSAPVTCRPAVELVPREYDQVLYQLGNELQHAFMAPMIRAIGGTVVQHDWVLFDMIAAAHPAILRGGLKGHGMVLREGGGAQLRTYLANWRERRSQRLRPSPRADADGQAGTLVYGWHAPEPNGRWCADHAALRIPAEGVRSVALEIGAFPGREVCVRQGGELLSSGPLGPTSVVPVDRDHPLLELSVSNVRVFREQKRHGDSRRLAAFVQAVRWTDSAGEHALDLSVAPALQVPNVHLARDRFLLPLNRSVVRFADAFLVHSEYVKQRILRERNANTSIGVVYHGAQRRWRDEDRRAARRRLGLDEAWTDSFLVTSFGGVQPHKRIDRALEALARARRERSDLRLVLAGKVEGGDFDPRGYARRLGIEAAVHFAGFVSEEDAWEWLHAGDVALNLRGPTSGGTSGGIFRAFSVGRPVIASDAGEQRELPDSCVVKVPLGEREVEALAAAFVDLRDDDERRRGLERAARAFVDEECHWSHVARRYVEYMERFPRPTRSPKARIKLRLALRR